MSSENQHQTLTDFLATQHELLQDAAEALPHDFSRCTHPLGHIRQAVYLCKTCPEQRGICSACSVACHTDHEQLELFPKRHFRCDCPTTSISHSCTLHKTEEDPNTFNTYGQNFMGVFCRCKRPYDATIEQETMIQCLACEDWFHESCLNLRDTPVYSENHAGLDMATISAENIGEEDTTSDTGSSSSLPPSLISESEYDSLVCKDCVLNIPIIKQWAGTSGVLMIIRDRDNREEKWKVIGSTANVESEPIEVDASTESVSVGVKRPRSPASEDGPSEEKRPRRTPDFITKAPCMAPPLNPIAQVLLNSISKQGPDYSLGMGDVFLTEGWRNRWCHCSNCSWSLEQYPFLKEEEETYEPPEDPDSALSLEELGLRALERLPRDRAIEGIHAFNSMRDDLVDFLRPFAAEGKVVNDADIEAFFESLRPSNKQARASK